MTISHGVMPDHNDVTMKDSQSQIIIETGAFSQGLIGLPHWPLVMTTVIAFLSFSGSSSATQLDSDPIRLLHGMSLEELSNVEVSSATLLPAKRRYVPAAVTMISQQDIKGSGARTLNELLQIYVPGLQLVRHHFGASHIGTRGFISGADNYFITVNGRPINKRSEAGAITERDLMLLAEIHHIEVIRGPGSAVYGFGAESLVIAITTFNGNTFDGSEIRARGGWGTERYSLEMKHGATLGKESAFFLYGGISDVPGASPNDAPYIFGTSFTDKDGTKVEAGEPADTLYSNDGAAYRDKAPMKLHAQLNRGGLEAWVRYSRGGEQLDNRIVNVAAPPVGNDTVPLTQQIGQVGYQQLGVHLNYDQELSNAWRMGYAVGYDMTDYERLLLNKVNLDNRQTSHQEDNYFARILTHWTPDDRFSLAVGFEFNRNEYGLRSPDFPDKAPSSAQFEEGMPRWHTQTRSALVDTHWYINGHWTAFFSARLDKHTFSEPEASPRFALVNTPTDQDTVKLILSRSNLLSYADSIKKTHDAGSGDIATETLDNIELRYERNHSSQLFSAISVYHQQIEAIGYDFVANKNVIVGEQEQAGTELELSFRGENVQLGLSHQYHNLIDFELGPTTKATFVTAAPYDFGNDLDSWSNHISKVDLTYRLNDRWRTHGNLQYLWKFDGMGDQVAYRNSTLAEDAQRTEPGWDDTFKKSVFLNLGIECKPSKHYTINLIGYHLLGLIDKDLNKQNYLGGFGGYRNLAPSIGIDISWTP